MVSLDIRYAYWHVLKSWLCHVFLAFSREQFPGVVDLRLPVFALRPVFGSLGLH